MRVLIINTSERIGGAAIAANRLMEALKKNGVKVKMLVRDKQTDHLTVFPIGHDYLQTIKFVWERLCIFMANKFSRRNLFQVDLANTGTDVTCLSEFQHADVIHLHWVNQGFLSLNNIRKIIQSGKKVVITMHDQWYFTGVCHYSGNCKKYERMCDHCELMNSTWMGDQAKKVFLKKKSVYANARLTFVGCSEWITQLASTSMLTQGHRVVSIPNTINTALFQPTNKKEARQTLGLPEDKYLLLFSCQRITDERNGFSLLVEALQFIKEQYEDFAKGIELVIVGGAAESIRNKVPFDLIALNYVSDPKEMVQIYNAVDIYVTPSLQDNLPNTVMETLACGTPCVGFNVGGIPEMIDHQKNGFVARYKDAQDFAKVILWTLTTNYDQLCHHAREKVLSTYGANVVARKYIEVYEG